VKQTTSLVCHPNGFTVAELTVNRLGIRVLVLECVQVQGRPDCGTVAGRVHSRRVMAVRDLTFRAPWLVRVLPSQRFVDVSRVDDATVLAVIETLAREGACPECGTVSARVKDRPVRRVKDLPCSGQRVELWWRKRRLVCLPAACPRRSFLDGGDPTPLAAHCPVAGAPGASGRRV